MAKDFKPQITKELQNVVKNNPNIKEVYFSEDGHYHFVKHEVVIHERGTDGKSKGSKKVFSLPGVKKSAIQVSVKKNNIESFEHRLVNVDHKEIAGMLTREDVLKAEAVGKSLTERQKMDILTQAAEIAKGNDIEGLLEKMNGGGKAKK